MTRTTRPLVITFLTLLSLICMGFEWPGRVVRLAQQLRSEDVAQRREAARLLGEHPTDEARAALLVGLDDDDSGVRQEAITAAAKIGLRDHVPVLIDWLNDPVADTRVAAAEALGVLREPRAEQALIRALGDTDTKVRTTASIALGRLGSPESVTPLLGRLDDPDPGTRLAAVRSLGELADPRALSALMGRTRDTDVDVKVAALGVLGALGDARALAPLLRSLDDETEEARLAAVAAIGSLAQAAAIEPLGERLAGADGRLGRAVIAALGAIGTDAAISLVVEQLGKPELSRGAIDVLVERVRRVRRLDPPAATAVLELLTRSLETTTDTARATAIQDALIGCSRMASIENAFSVLLDAFQSQRGTLPMSALSLAATHDERALTPLLERLETAQADDQLALLRALDVLTRKLPADGRAADPLLSALNSAQPQATALVTRLLGRTGAMRALPTLTELLGHTRAEVQLAAIEAIGAIGAPESVPALLPLMSDRREQVRDATVIALGQTLNAAQLVDALKQLTSLNNTARVTHLNAAVYAIDRLTHKNALAATDQTAVFTILSALSDDDDEAITALAVDGMGALGTAEAANFIASLLRSPNVSRRVHATRALGAFDDDRVRHVLRFVMTRGQNDVAVAAAGSLARIGQSEDAVSLAKLAKRYHWPFPGAASYALAVIARRGLLKPLASQAMLCELGRSREPIVRANVAIAMAQLGVGACDNGTDPLAWLQPQHAAPVRAAAARWVYAAVNAGRLDRAKGLAALNHCAARDPEPRVAEACAAPDLPPLDGTIRQVVTDPDGRVRLRHRLLSVELADGSVFVGHTDHNGHLYVANAPGEHAIVTDPGLLPLEPALSPTPIANAASRPASPPSSQP